MDDDEAKGRGTASDGENDGSKPAFSSSNGEEDVPQQKKTPPFLRFRLTYIDTVQTSPLDLPPPASSGSTSHDSECLPFIPARRIPFVPAGSGLAPDRVPELRIFGATDAGQRCCVHVHGAMPYVYVEYEGSVSPDAVQGYVNRLARAINACMAASLSRREPAKSLFVAFIVPVKGVPFYGFHVGYRYFLKIYTLDPKYMTRLATLLRSGQIMGNKKFIVYEAHIPYHLQFMLDSNLYGCGWVEIDKAKFREPVPEDDEVHSSAESVEEPPRDLRGPGVGSNTSSEDPNTYKPPGILTRSKIPPQMLYANADRSPPRISHSALELDIHVSWITNRLLIAERNLHADFSEFLHNPIPREYKFVHSVRELWEDERRRRNIRAAMAGNGVSGGAADQAAPPPPPLEETSENSAEQLGAPSSSLRGLTQQHSDPAHANDPDARQYGIGTQPPWQKFSENAKQFAALLEADARKYAAVHPGAPPPAFDTFVKKEKKGGWMERVRTAFESNKALYEETFLQDEKENNPFGAWGVRGTGVSVGNADNARDARSNAESRLASEELDVDPKYLKLLGTVDGRARLSKMERADQQQQEQENGKDAEYRDYDRDNDLDRHVDEEEEEEYNEPEPELELEPEEARLKQDEVEQPASDEEELDWEEQGRTREEDARAKGHRKPTRNPGARKPSTASGEIGRQYDEGSLLGGEEEQKGRHGQALGGQEEEDFDPLLGEEAELASSPPRRPPSPIANVGEQDPGLALLDQLVPLDDDDEMEEEQPSDGAQLDDEVEAQFRIKGNGSRSVSAPTNGKIALKSSRSEKEMADLKRAGLEDISFMDLSSEPMLSSPAREGSSTVFPVNGSTTPQAVPSLYSPRKRNGLASPGITPSKSPSIPGTTPSPAKKPSNSPSKVNYFSPAKSKLRNALVNPAFLAESRAGKRKRADELIGFRSIGEHGRTKLQQMLQVTVTSKKKGQAQQAQQAAGKEEACKSAEQGVQDWTMPMAAQHAREGSRSTTDGEGQEPLVKKTRLDFSMSDLSSSEEEYEHLVELEGTRPHEHGKMHILLSSAETAGNRSHADLYDGEAEVVQHNGSQDSLPATQPVYAPDKFTGQERDDAVDAGGAPSTQLAYAPERLSTSLSPEADMTRHNQSPRALTQYPGVAEYDSASHERAPPLAEHYAEDGRREASRLDMQLTSPGMDDGSDTARHHGTIGALQTKAPPTARNVRFVSVPVVESFRDDRADEDEDEGDSGSEDQAVRSSDIESEDEASDEIQQPTPLLRLTPLSSASQLPTHSSSAGSSLSHAPKDTWRFHRSAPTLFELLQDLDKHNMHHKLYQRPYWSNLADVPAHSFEYAGRRYEHTGESCAYLPDFGDAGIPGKEGNVRAKKLQVRPVFGFRKYEYALSPPSRRQVTQWLEEHSGNKVHAQQAKVEYAGPKIDAKGKSRVLDTQWAARSQVQGPTQANPFGVKFAQIMPSGAVMKEKEHMSSLAIEIHVNTRGDLLPNPLEDPMLGIFYCLQNEDDHIPDNGRKEGTHVGFIAVDHVSQTNEQQINFRKLGLSRYSIEVVEDEIDLIKALVDKVREWDPEIFTGYDVLKDSWGYLVERAEEIAPELEIITELSRVRTQSTGKKGSKSEDRWGYSKGATLRITGRHVLPVWRLLKSDANLTIYSFENVVFHILRQRVPRFSHAVLTAWYTSGIPYQVARVLQYLLLKVQLVIELLDEAEIVTRNAEFARVYGVDFYSVLTRGSQFKVESFMFKISKPENFMLPSPSREDVGKQNAAECIPLILEPESGFYNSPLLVFDFQSLYPSVMIAYNLCYSTCLGRLKEFLGTNRLGTSSLAIRPGTLTLMKDWVTLSPNGLMFLKPPVRRSLLAKMLTEILDTRVMVKKSMKYVDPSDKALSRLLNARQLGLKFIANVTYGYTSATFSGRMPCVEIADAIVQTGRETLERAKNTIQSRPDWGAIVRYGDTDSLFVHLPGKTKDEAFKIGNDIAETITKLNPKPVKLKFEKVYLPSFLLAKKRYVGFKFESPRDLLPDFDAKGIETVRRDGFPAMQKILETCIKIFFRTSDLSAVKLYVQQQFSRIMQNRVSPQDFIYAKEVKMGSYSDKVIPPPGAVVTGRRMLVDPRTEALYGERVPYIISKGLEGPGAKQAHRALTPEEFLSNRENALDDEHYIERIVKTLNRLFLLVGVDTQEWKNSTPRRMKAGKANVDGKSGRVRVDQHFGTASCPVCGDRKPTRAKYCSTCLQDSIGSTLVVQQRATAAEKRLQTLMTLCAACAKLPASETGACNSTDCPTLYSRVKAGRELEDIVPLLADMQMRNAKQQQEPYLVI